MRKKYQIIYKGKVTNRIYICYCKTKEELKEEIELLKSEKCFKIMFINTYKQYYEIQ